MLPFATRLGVCTNVIYNSTGGCATYYTIPPELYAAPSAFSRHTVGNHEVVSQRPATLSIIPCRTKASGQGEALASNGHLYPATGVLHEEGEVESVTQAV